MPTPVYPHPPTRRYSSGPTPQRIQLFGYDEQNRELFLTTYERLEDAIKDAMRSSADRLVILGLGVDTTTDTGVAMFVNPLAGADHTQNDLTIYLLC